MKIDPPGNSGCFLKINGNLCVDFPEASTHKFPLIFRKHPEFPGGSIFKIRTTTDFPGRPNQN